MEQEQFSKQKNLFNPQEKDKESTPIYIYGAGSTGSHTIIALAKTGFTNITIYDYDQLEENNIPAQFYKQKDTGKLKTEAIKEITKEMTGTEIITNNMFLDENFQPEVPINSIHILALDQLEIKQQIIQKLKEYQVWIIDPRIGGWNYQLYNYHTKKDKNKINELMKQYQGEFSEERCGEKCLWIVNTTIAQKITMTIIKILEEQQQIERKIIGNIRSQTTIWKNEL